MQLHGRLRLAVDAVEVTQLQHETLHLALRHVGVEPQVDGYPLPADAQLVEDLAVALAAPPDPREVVLATRRRSPPLRLKLLALGALHSLALLLHLLALGLLLNPLLLFPLLADLLLLLVLAQWIWCRGRSLRSCRRRCGFRLLPDILGCGRRLSGAHAPVGGGHGQEPGGADRPRGAPRCLPARSGAEDALARESTHQGCGVRRARGRGGGAEAGEQR
mmetsp:Transcript_19154/g.46246  ORF Transcript_19154/g.46246 Transcript_19154/m.46246 type:complete len:219 (-) Transcript_19154:18-674(-)